MLVPVLPVFDDDLDPESATAFNLPVGRLIVFTAAVRVACGIKRKFWDKELQTIRESWSGSALSLAVFIGSSLLMNIVLVAFAGLIGCSLILQQPLLPIYYRPNVWMLAIFCGISQCLLFMLKLLPGLLWDSYFAFQDPPAPALQFAPVVDFLVSLCVLPVMGSLLLCGIPDFTELTPHRFAIFVFSLLVAVLLPTVSYLPPLKKLNSEPNLERKSPLRKQTSSKKNSRTNLRSKSKETDTLQFDPKKEFLEEPERKLIFINSENISPVLMSRVQQLEAQQQERRMSLRSFQKKQKHLNRTLKVHADNPTPNQPANPDHENKTVF